MVEYKTSGEIDAMHAAGQVVARILAAVRAQAVPGVRLAELDATARDVLAEAGAPRQRRAVGWATSAPLSGRSAAAPATAYARTSAATASATRCTRTRTCPTSDGRAAALA
jgi:Xaa-Pro aminopeptidase